MAKLWGWQIKRESENFDQSNKRLPSDDSNDGSLVISNSGNGYFSGIGINFDSAPVENEIELITLYREVAMQPEIEKGIDNIINQFFSYDEDAYPVSINMDAVDKSILSEKTKEAIREEFNVVLELLNFKTDAYYIVRKWYVDGRLFFQKIIDEKNPSNGLTELRYIDPRKIKKIRIENKNPNTEFIKDQNQLSYYLYNSDGINLNQPTGTRLTTDSICYVHSGLFDKTNKTAISYLHKAIRSYNLLRHLEDSTVVYTLVRAPERRIFNLEVGGMPPAKQEQYVREQMGRHRKKIMYDPTTGKVKDERRYMSMLEDYWFPKKDGKGTTVDTLNSGANFSDLANLDYFRNKLHESLGIPSSRYDNNSMFNVGRTSEITRDELMFMKFIARLRKRFSFLFDDLLGSHLILKGILSLEEWEVAKNYIYYDYLEDNFFTELKWAEIWKNRSESLSDTEALVEKKYVSKKWVRKNILRMTEEEYEDMKKEIEEESKEDEENQPDDSSSFSNPKDFKTSKSNNTDNFSDDGMDEEIDGEEDI